VIIAHSQHEDRCEAIAVDPQHAKVSWTVDGKEILGAEYKWADADYLTDERTVHWETGEHELAVSIEPVYPELQPLRTKMEYRVLWVTLDGPLAKERVEHHPNYPRFYTRERPPEDPAERRVYAREVLARLVEKLTAAPPSRTRSISSWTLREDLLGPGHDVRERDRAGDRGSARLTALPVSPRRNRVGARRPAVRTARRILPGVALSYALWASMPTTNSSNSPRAASFVQISARR